MEKETNSRANKFDVIVVGAGPAGSSAAITAQKNGLKVAIIDKQAFPRNKLCAALFSGRALRSMKCVFSSIPDDSYFLNNNSVAFKWGGTTIRNFTNDHKLRLS
jgi:flavin-dependent dehydrogenase